LALELVRTRLLRYLRGIFRSLGYAAGTEKEEAGGDGGRVGFLAYVAVDESRRGHGIGGRLFEAYEELASEAGLRRLELVTLPDERGAAPFFERMGWEREGEITSRSGERYAFFTRHLGGREAGP
jgi:GNAT superfamily N-acetyltransferase